MVATGLAVGRLGDVITERIRYTPEERLHIQAGKKTANRMRGERLKAKSAAKAKTTKPKTKSKAKTTKSKAKTTKSRRKAA